MKRPFVLLCLALAFAPAASRGQSAATPPWAAGLRREASTVGKPSWRPMLQYDVTLHVADTHPATPPFAFPWEDTGRGYGYGPGTAHWDLIHEAIDTLHGAPVHTREQILNEVRLQLPSGFLPGLYWMREFRTAATPPMEGLPAGVPVAGGEKFSPTQSNPPMWVVAADDYMTQTHDTSLAAEFLDHAARQIAWFQHDRAAQPDGFLYLDIVNNKWESGVDEGVRFDGTGPGHQPATTACIDATSHVYQLATYAAKWARLSGADPAPYDTLANRLRHFIQTALWSERDGFFYDSWVLERFPDGPRATWHDAAGHRTPAPGRAHPFEGMWPIIVGAATPEQARRVITEWTMRPDRFFTPHPVSTVARSDPQYEPRMWRGPCWNSMTYWAARAALRYGYPRQAHQLLERALDDSAAQFTRTGTIWEFYDADAGPPEALHRKPQTKRNMPFRDYMGHNPLLAMAELWQQTR